MIVEIEKTPLDSILLVEQRCRSAFSNIFSSVDIETGDKFDINCNSWRCEKHREKWGKKWASIIADQLERTPVTLLVNLTTAQRTSNVEIFEAMRYFIRRFRAEFGPTDYIKVVEENRKHTQPHFHCLFCCRDLVIPPRPPYDCKCTQDTKCTECKRSYPDHIFEKIKKLWGDALEFATPSKKRTKIVWCQPPQGQGQQAATYALGYITGKDKTKDEEPGRFWRGRKLTYSKSFFNERPPEIWKRKLVEWFGERRPLRFAWLVNSNLETDTPRCDKFGEIKHYNGDLPDLAKFAAMPVVKERFAEYQFFQAHGHFPLEATREISLTVVYEVTLDGQEYFVT